MATALHSTQIALIEFRCIATELPLFGWGHRVLLHQCASLAPNHSGEVSGMMHRPPWGGKCIGAFSLCSFFRHESRIVPSVNVDSPLELSVLEHRPPSSTDMVHFVLTSPGKFQPFCLLVGLQTIIDLAMDSAKLKLAPHDPP